MMDDGDGDGDGDEDGSAVDGDSAGGGEDDGCDNAAFRFGIFWFLVRNSMCPA